MARFLDGDAELLNSLHSGQVNDHTAHYHECEKHFINSEYPLI